MQPAQYAGSAAELQRYREGGTHIVQPVEQRLANGAEQEIVLGESACRAIAMTAHQMPIENRLRITHLSLITDRPLARKLEILAINKASKFVEFLRSLNGWKRFRAADSCETQQL
jgi:hypothetical protein